MNAPNASLNLKHEKILTNIKFFTSSNPMNTKTLKIQNLLKEEQNIHTNERNTHK